MCKLSVYNSASIYKIVWLQARRNLARVIHHHCLFFCFCSCYFYVFFPSLFQLALFRLACKAHVKYMRAATNGDGVDRHLLGLRLLARGAGVNAPFLTDKVRRQLLARILLTVVLLFLLFRRQCSRHFLSTPFDHERLQAMSLPFRLSTSQTPAMRMLGGGFAPLAANGYGCAYVVDDHRIWAHLSSFASCAETE